MHQKNENRINTVVDTAIKNISSLLDVNTVIGKPILTDDGSTVIPVTKVTLGVLSGGGEYGKVTVFKSGEDLPFSAGNGAVISVKPCAFLIKENKDEKYKILSVGGSSYDKIIDKSAEIIEKLTETDQDDAKE